MAMHALWWTPFIESFIEHLSFGNSIKSPWKSVETLVYYDRVYQLIIGELVKYVAEVVPRAYRQQPERLLELVRSNPTAVFAFTFLFEFGLPWLRLRHAIRTNDHAVIDVMWTYTFHWCSTPAPTCRLCISAPLVHLHVAGSARSARAASTSTRCCASTPPSSQAR